MDNEAEVRRQLEDSIRITGYLREEAGLIIAIAGVVATAISQGKKLLLFGNGGSAADAQHIAAELAGRFYVDRAALPAIALTTNTSILTAIGNDYGYDTVFARQLQGLTAPGDAVVALSTSGNSPSVILTIEEAKRLGAVTIGFSGKGGGKLAGIVDYALTIPSDDTPRIQEAHITAGHLICYLIERSLFGPPQ